MSPCPGRTRPRLVAALSMFGATTLRLAAENAAGGAAASQASGLPDSGASFLRVFGALVFVLAVFFAGVWVFRNARRVAGLRAGGAQLALLEVKSLGQRQAIYVVGYKEQRMLLGSSPAGITLISHLPAAAEGENPPPQVNVTFADALNNVLGRKT